jgi:hypothetical protein
MVPSASSGGGRRSAIRVGFDEDGGGEAEQGVGVGEDATTSVRCSISLFSHSKGLVDQIEARHLPAGTRRSGECVNSGSSWVSSALDGDAMARQRRPWCP